MFVPTISSALPEAVENMLDLHCLGMIGEKNPEPPLLRKLQQDIERILQDSSLTRVRLRRQICFGETLIKL